MSSVRLKGGSNTVETMDRLVRAVACQRCQLSELLHVVIVSSADYSEQSLYSTSSCALNARRDAVPSSTTFVDPVLKLNGMIYPYQIAYTYITSVVSSSPDQLRVSANLK